MKKSRKWLFGVVCLLVLVIFPIEAKADIGPKPSVVVSFTGLEEETYYVTLLSEKESTGPWSYGNEYYDYMGSEAAFQKFKEYKDEDGYYFLSFMEECSEDDTFEWTYYPPSKFKILVYFPELDAFAKTENVYERYAFDSYFTVDVSDMEKISKTISVEAEKSYDATMEIVSLVARVVLTIGVEFGIAILFGYRDKKSLSIIGITNIITQLILNGLLNIFNYHDGHYAFVFHYVWMEIIVLVIELMVYSKFKEEMATNINMKKPAMWYAITANIVSFVVGMGIARVIPGIF